MKKVRKNLKRENITLEEALKNFEEGIAYYKQCSEILNSAKQKVKPIPSKQEERKMPELGAERIRKSDRRSYSGLSVPISTTKA